MTEQERKLLGAKLKELREARGYSLRAMADMVNEKLEENGIDRKVSKDVILRVENGGNQKVREFLYEAMALALGVSLQDVLSGDSYQVQYIGEDGNGHTLQIDKLVFTYLSNPENMRKVLDDARDYYIEQITHQVELRKQLLTQ